MVKARTQNQEGVVGPVSFEKLDDCITAFQKIRFAISMSKVDKRVEHYSNTGIIKWTAAGHTVV